MRKYIKEIDFKSLPTEALILQKRRLKKNSLKEGFRFKQELLDEKNALIKELESRLYYIQESLELIQQEREWGLEEEHTRNIQ